MHLLFHYVSTHSTSTPSTSDAFVLYTKLEFVIGFFKILSAPWLSEQIHMVVPCLPAAPCSSAYFLIVNIFSWKTVLCLSKLRLMPSLCFGLQQPALAPVTIQCANFSKKKIQMRFQNGDQVLTFVVRFERKSVSQFTNL